MLLTEFREILIESKIYGLNEQKIDKILAMANVDRDAAIDQAEFVFIMALMKEEVGFLDDDMVESIVRVTFKHHPETLETILQSQSWRSFN